MRRSRPVPLLLVALLLALSPAAAAAQVRPRPQALAQIRALLAEKAARTQVERKIASRLLYTLRMRRGRDVAPGIRLLHTGVELDPTGSLLVDLRSEVTQRLLAEIAAVGGRVVGSWPGFDAVRAWLPAEACESIAGLPEVVRLRPADLAFTNADVSEGVEAHRVDLLRSTYGADGTGLHVGVLSDGVESLAALQASGDLPPVTVLPGQAGSGNEGTAMLEIVHDMAPGAELSFATAFGGVAGFAANILALRDAGADVIVDDVRYFSESIFQDGPIAQSVDDVAAGGVLYFSSAGNEGNLGSGTSGVWEGDFVDSGTILQGSPAHDFGGGVLGNVVTWDSPFVFMLQWSDPDGGSANDYDLFLLDSEMSSVVSSSTDEQNGNDDPYEIIDSRVTNNTGHHLVVVLWAGAPRYLHLNSFRGALGIATDGQIGGHTAAKGAISTAAVDVRSAAGPGGAFAGTESVQSYSSDGPRLVFYQPDGIPLTPSLLSDGGSLRAKPQLAAADCVDTATPGFNTFCGTSAAAPHAAGIAAVLLELALSRGQGSAAVRDVLLGSALDIEEPGFDYDAGHGLADALAAAQALLLEPPNLPALGVPGLALLAGLLALCALLSPGAGSAGPAAGRPRRRR